jgi:hypothetical protein
MTTPLQKSYETRHRKFHEAIRMIESAYEQYGRNIPPRIAVSLKRDLIYATTNLALLLRSVAVDKKRMGSANTIRDNASMRRNIEKGREEEEATGGSLATDIDDSITVVRDHKDITDDTSLEISDLADDLSSILSGRF